MFYQKANMFWHCDSAFKAIPSLCSVLTARIVPPQGGATEFASTRAVHAGLNAAEQADVAPVRHRLVRTNKANGLKSVMIGAHAKCVVGWPEKESRALLDDLLARVTRGPKTPTATTGKVVMSSSGTIRPPCITPPNTTPPITGA